MVYCHKKKIKDIPVKVNFQGRSYINYDKTILNQHLMEMDWDTCDSLKDPNALWEVMLRNILSSIDRMCPIQTFKVKKYKEQWISQEIL